MSNCKHLNNYIMSTREGWADCLDCDIMFEIPLEWRSQPDGFYETENQINQTKENK